MNAKEALFLLKTIDEMPGMNPLLFGEITKAVIEHVHKMQSDIDYIKLVNEIMRAKKLEDIEQK